MEKNAASVTWRTILLKCAEVEIKNLKGEHRNLLRAFPWNLQGEFIELKKSNQQSPMMKFTACIQSLTAAVLNKWFNLSWEVDRQVIGLRWPCRLIADQRLIACYVYRWPLVGTAWNKTRVLRNSNMAVECWYVTWCQNNGISCAAEWNLAQRYGRRIC